MPLLVHSEEQHLIDLEEALLAHVVGLDLEDQPLQAGVVGEELHQPLVAWPSALGGQQLLARLELVAGLELLLGLRDEFADDARLLFVEVADESVVLLERRRRVLAHRTRDDEGRPGLVDEDGVHLVDDGVPVPALHALLQGVHHVVAQVVEAELVVGPICNVSAVPGRALGRVGFVLVYAVDVQAEVVVDVAHPLGVALSQIGVHRDQMRAPPRKGVQIKRHGGHERLSLSGGHLGDAPTVEGNGTHELHVVGNHVPDQLLAGDDDLRPHQSAARFLDRGEGLGKDLFEALGGHLDPSRVEVAQGFLKLLPAVGILGVALLLSERLDLRFHGLGSRLDTGLEVVRLALQLLLGERRVLLVIAVDLVDHGLELLRLTNVS